jgi:HEAT repeat protein
MSVRFVLLTAMVAALLLCPPRATAGDPEETRKLLAVLQSDAALPDKAHACQRLAEVGTPEAVPALAALLPDEHLSAYARSGLEGIPDPSAAAALRHSLATLTGPRLAGVIASLGVLRDAQAVPLLAQRLADPAAGVVQPALLALGRIATDAAIQLLRQALAGADAATRADAAAGCLLAAEQQWADGHADSAVALYDAVRQAQVPDPYRLGATRGAILARGPAGVPLLIEHLRSADPGLRATAFLTVHERPSDALANALNTELAQAPAERLPQLLTLLEDCHNTQSLAVLRGKATSADPATRRAALAVLGTLGDATAADVLLAAVAANRDPEESTIAVNSLRRIAGTTVDEQILKALASATSPGQRLPLVRLLEARGVTRASNELLTQAATGDAEVSVAALHALKSLAGAPELPALIALTKACQDDAVRDAAEGATIAVCMRAEATAPVTATVLAELTQATAPAVRNSWIRILSALGAANALPALRAALNDADATVASTAITQLGRWPDPAPVEDLLAIVATDAEPLRRQRALASVLRLAAAAAAKQQRPDDIVVGWLRRANRVATSSEDQRLIISVLGRLRHPESLRLLLPYLDDPGVQTEAALAVVQIAPALMQEDPAAASAALEKTAAVTSDAGRREHVQKLAASVTRRGWPTPLFDGQSLAGWEGKPGVWRVRDGVIVGGSLEGNPQNEFLATTRTYGDFVLRLEYRLVGTEGFVNGGVQFRSTRLAPPAAEMCGYQADIGAGHSGCLYDESRRNQFLARASDERIRHLEIPGAWNRYEVRCLGRRVQIVLNGEKTVDYTETDPAIPRDGLVALQIHGACKAEISFRNLAIGELSYGLATREFCIPRTGWKILSCSSENTQGEDERAVLAIDGNPATFWHTQWSGATPGHPHHLAIDLGEDVEINGFTYLPRQDGRQERGVIGAYEVYVSRDGKEWGQPLANGRFEDTDKDPSGRVVTWPQPATARYLKLVALDAPGGHPFAGAAEIGVLGTTLPR